MSSTGKDYQQESRPCLRLGLLMNEKQPGPRLLPFPVTQGLAKRFILGCETIEKYF
jgi:hypothetical protein